MAPSASYVDLQSGCSASSKLYRDADGVLWSFLLNLTDVSDGTYGNNRFYLGQLIMDRDSFVVFRKWGRVGGRMPESKTERYEDVEKAQQAFQKTFKSKSGNEWPLTQPFERKNGKYWLVEVDGRKSKEVTAKAGRKVKKKQEAALKLPHEVQDVVQVFRRRNGSYQIRRSN